MQARSLLCALLLLPLMAGCADPGPAAPTADAAPAGRTARDLEAVQPTRELHTKEGQLDAGIGATTDATGTCWAEVGADRVLEFDVPENTTVLLLELAWDDDVQDLTLVASPPGTPPTVCPETIAVDAGSTGMPDSPARLLIQSPAPGDWMLGAQANGVVATSITYSLYATVSSMALAPGYTAIGASAA